MRIRKYRAPDMRTALVQIRNELGPDALIVATQEIRSGFMKTEVEVTAAIDDVVLPPAPAEPTQAAAAGLGQADVERIFAPIRSEIRSLRSLVRAVASERSQQAASNPPTGSPAESRPARSRARAPAPRPHVAPSTGRIVALVGPTGVGKTTTIAKLAANDALRHGRSVHIISLDSYRVGAAEQIGIFAELMGVPCTMVTDPRQLPGVIARLEGVDRIYIDTAGRSPTDTEAVAQLAHALQGLSDLEVHLTVAAATSKVGIDRCFQRYRNVGIHRLLFTKVDEAEGLGELVFAPARLELPVTYLTTGQRVPEDLERATPARIVQLIRDAATAMESAA